MELPLLSAQIMPGSCYMLLSAPLVHHSMIRVYHALDRSMNFFFLILPWDVTGRP
jgi:hypothetical protein